MLQRCDDDWSFGLDNYDDDDYPFNEEAYFNIHNAMYYEWNHIHKKTIHGPCLFISSFQSIQ